MVWDLLSVPGPADACRGSPIAWPTGGTAIPMDGMQVAQDQARLAAHGVSLELSGAAPLTALRQLLACHSASAVHAMIVGTAVSGRGG